jgi:Right handed beta helix region/Pectate lyase superfamily protein
MASVRDFGAKGDGRSDDTAAVQHAVETGDGVVEFPRGDYLLTRPVLVPLAKVGRLSLDGRGGTAKLIVANAGPALHLVGTHARTAQPDHFADGVWKSERRPTVRDLEIVGGHPQADGVRVEGAMQPTLTGLLIRRCRHGIHLTNRNRNVIISDCHVYDNTGVGVFLDRLNLHQINIHGNHISYCQGGGIVISESEIRNIQICSNDIEYNYDPKAPASADVLFDARKGTIREGTISGNTIQAKQSPGGANVRFLGAGKDDPNAVGMIALTGNLIGSQESLIHLAACRGVTVVGNCLYNGFHYALRAEDAEHLVIGCNSIDHNSDYKGNSTDAVLLRGCRNVTLTGVVLQHTRPAELPVEASVTLRDCRQVQVSGSQVVNARRRGVDVIGCELVRIDGCTIRGKPGDADYRSAVHVDAASRLVSVSGNFLGKGSDGDLLLPAGSGSASGNAAVL